MRHDLEVSGTIEINADPAKVWKGLTDPAIIKEYLFGTETVTDWKVGSEVIFQGEYNEHKYRDKGAILENELHKTISYSYWSGFSGLEDKPENYFVMSYILTEEDGQTKLEIIQEDNRPNVVQEEPQGEENPVLQSLKKVAEAS